MGTKIIQGYLAVTGGILINNISVATSTDLETGLAATSSALSTGLASKADLVDGKISAEQLPEPVSLDEYNWEDIDLGPTPDGLTILSSKGCHDERFENILNNPPESLVYNGVTYRLASAWTKTWTVINFENQLKYGLIGMIDSTTMYIVMCTMNYAVLDSEGKLIASQLPDTVATTSYVDQQIGAINTILDEINGDGE